MNNKNKKIGCALLIIFFLVIYGFFWIKQDVITAKITLVTMIVVIFIDFKKNFKLSKVKNTICNFKNWYQVGSIAFFILLFLICAIINKLKNGMIIPDKIYWVVGILFGIILVVILNYYINYTSKKIETKFFDIGSIIIIAVVFLTRIPMFTRIQMWDGIIYYGALQEVCENFDFTIVSIWNYFRLAGHFTFAYTFFMSMGEFLIPGEIIGVQIVMLIMTSIALVCIYKLFQGYWNNMTKLQALIMTVMVSVIPSFYGMFSNINIDYFLLIFFIYLIYAEYKNWEIMRFFWMLCVVLTKETGLFIVAGYCIAYILLKWRETLQLNIKYRFTKLLDDSLIRSMIIGVIALCCFVLIQGSLFTWMGIGQKSFMEMMENYIRAANGKNLFMFVLSFVIHKFVQLFTMNFTWLPTLFILFVIIKSCREKRAIKNEGMVGVLGALSTFLLFSIFSTILIASTVSRYAIFSMVFLWIVAIVTWYSEYGIKTWGKNRIITVVGIIILLFIQSFVYIDPITNLWFDRLNTGNGLMISGEKDYNNYGDTFVNNYYYRYIEELIDEMLREIDYNEDLQIVNPYKREYMCITGNVEPFSIRWDIENKCRTMSKSYKKKTIPINQIELFMMEDLEKSQIKPKAITYFMPYIECDKDEIFEELKKYYNIGEKHVITNWGGSIIFYELEYSQVN